MNKANRCIQILFTGMFVMSGCILIGTIILAVMSILAIGRSLYQLFQITHG